MTAEPFTMSSEVEVDVDPVTAFSVFTDEIDLWWVRSPISFYEGWRAVGKRCEPGVGGRLIEVYDAASGEGLELGRITAWEPGVRLAWDSSVDDARIEVRFEPVAAGTRVRVIGTVPVGGQGNAGLAWVRVGPKWMGDWVRRRSGGASREPAHLGRLAVSIAYRKPVTAARWLAAAFGLGEVDELPGDESEWDLMPWIEFHAGESAIIVFKLDDEPPARGAETHMPWVFVDDLDAHLATATANGARVVEPIHEHGYRAYVAEDLEGNRWTFAQAGPTFR